MDEQHEQVHEPEAETVNEVPPATEPTGLRRSTKRRMIGGVAGGIGERFDIDPNIVRVIFVVLTVLFGLGAAIYLAMWVLIPQSGKASDGDVYDANAPVTNTRLLSYLTLAGVVVAVIIVLSTFNNRPRVGNGFAWLWLVFLFVLAVLSLRSSARQHMLRRLIALVFLAILTFFILTTGAALGFLASTGVPMTGGSGARVVQPTNAGQVQSTYRTEFGTLIVDLRQVHFPMGTRTITASVTAGILTIDLPSNAIVYLKTKVGIGHVEYDVRSGPTSQPFSAVPPSLNTAARQRNAPHLVIDAQVGAGEIYFRRAGQSN
jgi:phage shock protein C